LAPSRNRFFLDANKDPDPELLRKCGPIMNVVVHVPTALAKLLGEQGTPVPPPHAGMALIDTGASGTCVHESILKSLQVNPIGSVTSGTAAGPTPHNLYPVRLQFPWENITRDFDSVVGVDLTGQFVEVSTGRQPIVVLVGRDVLRDWIFIYNGGGGVISIAF
jgi:hypothetical protein